MKASLFATAAAILCTAGIAAAQTQPGPATPPGGVPQAGDVITEPPPDPSVSMDRLQRATEDLRKAIQAMAEQQPGPRRDEAMREADRAILQTQEAMVQLPPDLRTRESYRDTQLKIDETRRLLHDEQANPAHARAAAEDVNAQMPKLRAEMGAHAGPGQATGAPAAPAPTMGGGQTGQPPAGAIR